MELSDFAKQLRIERERRGWTHDHLGQLSGVNAEGLAAIEDGSFPNPGENLRLKIQAAFWTSDPVPPAVPVAISDPKPAPPAPIASPKSLVTFEPNGNVRAEVGSVAEAKLAIKECRIRKREISAEKKLITTRMSEIRVERREQIASQGTKMRGGGSFGRIVRNAQSIGRDADRRSHANRLAPLEDEKARLERMAVTIDQVITQLETYILQKSN